MNSGYVQMKNLFLSLFLLLIIFLPLTLIQAQTEDEEQIVYYQMEPLDDSLFIKMQTEIFIDPTDPKAEIIVDLRDPNNQTVSIKGALYPFLAFTPEIRARIITYPFKINLVEDIHYGSVFSRVIEKIRLSKVIAPPTASQISPSVHYVNPFFQLFGGERLGIPIKKDLGLSMGVGTPYSGPLETNIIEANFHLLGFYGGIMSSVDAMTEVKASQNHNNLYISQAYQLGYVIPFGNFFQISFIDVFGEYKETKLEAYQKYDTPDFQATILSGSYLNWEFRYPFSFMGSTRAKVYAARYLSELHFGFTGRELSLAGSTFDLRFDAMTSSNNRPTQYVMDIIVQKIAESWGFSAFALGPSIVFGRRDDGKMGITSIFGNFRLKIGTSL